MIVSAIGQGMLWALLGLGIFYDLSYFKFSRYDHRRFISVRGRFV